MLHTWKRILALVLMLTLCLCQTGATLADQGLTTYTLGSEVQDFTVTTYDGQTVTLSEALKEKDMVLLNIWASWCGPCEMEFPYLQEAYAAYQDHVAVIAVSCEDGDTDEVLRTYAEERGLTFPIARDTENLAYRFNASSIPTSVVIDRFGKVGYVHTGAITSAEEFTRLFDAFTGETYTQTRTLSVIPAMRPNIPNAEVSKLAEALDAPWTFQNPTDVYVWPMIPAEVDDRLCLMSTNSGMDGMQSLVTAALDAKAGDALAITFRLSSETGYDFFQISINGETIKVFSGERDWMTYAWEVPADGAYTLALSYVKDSQDGAGEDLVYIDSAALLTGDAAAAALAGNPVYPISDVTALTITTEGARKIVFDDPTYILSMLFGLAEYYIVPDDTVDFRATLAADIDPEGAYFTTDSSVVGAVSVMDAEGYHISIPAGEGYSAMTFVPAQNCLLSEVKTAVVFSSEADVETLLSLLSMYGMPVQGWEYAEVAAAAASVELPTPAIVRYTLTLLDQDGAPVAGAIANICDADTCTTLVSDAEGIITFEKAPYAYDVHLIKVPEGYTFDTTQAIEIPVSGGSVEVLIEKNK